MYTRLRNAPPRPVSPSRGGKAVPWAQTKQWMDDDRRWLQQHGGARSGTSWGAGARMLTAFSSLAAGMGGLYLLAVMMRPKEDTQA